MGGEASTSCGRTNNVSREGVLSAPALPARCPGLRRRRETARQMRADSERRRGGEAAHTPDHLSLGPPRSPASLRQARRTGQRDRCTVAPLTLHVGVTPARSPQSIRGRPPAAEAAVTPSESAATPAIWHSGALVGACLFTHRRGKAWACGLRRSPPRQTLARSALVPAAVQCWVPLKKNASEQKDIYTNFLRQSRLRKSGFDGQNYMPKL